MAKKYYAVKNGRQTGLFTDWGACRTSVDGYRGAEYQGFQSRADALEYLGGDSVLEERAPQKKYADAGTGSMDYIIYTDGGCARNPGGRGGYGVVMIGTGTGEIREFSEGFRSTTNNRMEIMAVIRALHEMEPGTSAELYSDSQYTINCMTGVWAKEKNRDLWNRIRMEGKGKSVTLHWVRGHNGDPYNERCDELATEAMTAGDLKEDTGYSGPETDAAPGAARASGAMGVKICVPDNLKGLHADRCPSVTALVSDRKVNSTCAKNIRIFLSESRHSFRSYVNLRTDGLDYWSRKPLDVIIAEAENGEAVWNVVRQNLGEGRVAMAAMRWYMRGLPVEDAVRKVLVDQEVSENAMKSR